MNWFRTFCFAIALIGGHLMNAQNQPEIHPGVLYIKMKPSSPIPKGTPINTKPSLNLQSSPFVTSYESLQKASSNQRTNATSRLSRIYRVQVDQSMNIDSLIQALSSYQNIEYAEPVYKEQLLYIPSDPAIVDNNQNYLSQIKAFDAWDITQGSEEVIIGIVDTGLDRTHEDIVNKLYHNPNELPGNGIDDDGNGYIDDFTGYDFASRDSIAQIEESVHGNFVGGIAGAETDNEIGIAGAGFRSKISPLKIFDGLGSGSFGSYEAIIYAADNGYDVVNLSWGSPNSYNQTAQEIINYAVLDNNVVVVAAAGNRSDQTEYFPASYDHVLSVAASNLTNDEKAFFSSYNYKVDLVAPGNGVFSTTSNNGYENDFGTSLSAPLVAGTAALIKAVDPELSAVQIMELIRVNTDPIYDLIANEPFYEQLGSGRLNMFKALSKENEKSIRATNESFQNGLGNYAYYGDTLTANFDLNNYLGSVTNLRATLSSPTPFLEIPNPIISVPANLNTMQEHNVGEIQLILGEDTPPDSLIPLRLHYQDDSGYEDFQYISFKTSPDFLALSNGRIHLPITGGGDMGTFSGNNSYTGTGLLYLNQKVVSQMGLFIGKSPDQSSNNIAVNVTESDFMVSKNIKLSRFQDDILMASNSFRDSTAFTIDQRTFLRQNDDFLIIEYRIANQSPDTLKNLSGGLFLDWLPGDGLANQAYYDSAKYTIKVENLSQTLFGGVRIYFDSEPIPQAIDLLNNGSTSADYTNLTDSLIYVLATVPTYDSAGFMGSGNDIATMIATDSLTIAPNESKKIVFMMGLATNDQKLDSVLNDAETTYSKILNNPPLLESVVSCEGASLAIAPRSGDQFRFYRDPLAKELIMETDTLFTGAITSDTSFYVINVDSSEGPIQKIAIQLISNVADFSLSKDTLYLDDPLINTVQFQDNSFHATNWDWDFGNGIKSQVQDPTLNFNTPGTYQVQLTVLNNLGCEGNVSKSLLVVDRPPGSDFLPVMLCPEETMLLEANENKSLSVYGSINDLSPAFTSSSILIGPFLNDTCIYVTNREGPFESLKNELCIQVDNPKASFSFFTDSTSNRDSILFVADIAPMAGYHWYLNGELYDHERSVRVFINSAPFEISLTIINASGCTDSIGRSILIKESPTPEVTFTQPCINESLLISPTNGKTFGFYADPELDRLIKIGQHLFLQSVDDSLSIYVVGLDSLGVSETLSIEIQPKQNSVQLFADPPILYLDEKQIANFSFSPEAISDWTWFLDGEPEKAKSPSFYFKEHGVYDIMLETISTSGCIGKDSIQYTVLPEREKLLLPLDPKKPIFVYPNPAKDNLTFQMNAPYISVKAEILDLSGKMVLEAPSRFEETYVFDISSLKNGIYLLSIRYNGGTYLFKIKKQS